MASIEGAMARLKNFLNQPPVQTNQILPQYFFQAYGTQIMKNKQVITTLYGLELKAQRQEKEKCYCTQRMFGTYKRPTETQCNSFVSKPTLYGTHWDITSETIRVRQQAYKASPHADLTSPLCILICQKSLYSENDQDSSPTMFRTKQRTHTCNVYISRLFLYSFLAAYKAQVQKTAFDQIVRNSHFCVMTQLSKTICYCNKMSTDILSSLHPMPKFQPHKKMIMATGFPHIPPW